MDLAFGDENLHLLGEGDGAMRAGIIAVVLAAMVAMAGAALVVWRGLYDVSATSAHTQVVYSLLEVAMHRSVKFRAADIEPPELRREPLILRGAACFRDWCMQCHGAPGVAPSPVGMSLQPLPGSLVDAARRWHPREMYWITRHGIKMSGMPAWEFRLTDEDIWAVTAFLTGLPTMSPRQYEAMASTAAGAPSCRTIQGVCANPPCTDKAVSLAGARTDAPSSKPAPAPVLFRQHACTACHAIPGVAGSELHVGPPLMGLSRRSLIAGKLSNTEDELVRWIRFPRKIDPETAMPDSGVSEAHARQMARYLLQER